MFRLMGHETIYRRKNLTKGALKAYIKPYLMRGLKIERANQVWCSDVLEAAMAENGVPGIINSDQGSQYTSPSWTNYLERNGIKISMDGKGRATDNIWIERFWKTIKYNHIYLNPCDTGLELYEGVQTYIEYYHQKKHQGIGMKPNDAYYKSLNQIAA
jgi:putative transposase